MVNIKEIFAKAQKLNIKYIGLKGECHDITIINQRDFEKQQYNDSLLSKKIIDYAYGNNLEQLIKCLRKDV